MDTSAITDAAQSLPPLVFTPPIATTPGGPTHPACIGVRPNGAEYLVYVDQPNEEIRLDWNHGLGGTPYEDTLVDWSLNYVGNPRAAGTGLGQLWFAWYHNLSDGSGNAVVKVAMRDPRLGNLWNYGPATVPGSLTGPAIYGGAEKVIGIAAQPGGAPGTRVAVLWSRNKVGAGLTWTDDGGAHWAIPVRVPAPLSPTASDFDVAVTTTGMIVVAWFDRDGAGDIKARWFDPRLGTWGAVQDVSPQADQDYTPRLAGAPDGGVRLGWTGKTTDVFYRECSPAGVWGPIIRLTRTPGSGDSRALELVVGPDGTAYLCFDDDTGRAARNVTTYVMYGRGATWSAPQQPFAALGPAACCRYPSVALGGGALHLVTNSNGAGPFRNYTTYARL